MTLAAPGPDAAYLAAGPGDDLATIFAAALESRTHLVVHELEQAPATETIRSLLAHLDADPGIASVSALGRAALGALEQAGGSEERPSEALGPAVVAQRLASAPSGVLSVATPFGPVVALGRGALSRVRAGPGTSTRAAWLASWAEQAAERAFTHLLDTTTFVDASVADPPVVDVVPPDALDDARARDAG
ncbi:MAG: hypothetical protein ABIV94_10645, partial [Acidimicrobiales bacterium]